MNKLPEVATMLGFKYCPDIPDFEILICGEWYKSKITEHGLMIIGYGHRKSYAPDRLVGLLLGWQTYRPVPRYTIPEDLPVDAPVWVANIEDSHWFPKHFQEVTGDPDNPYYCWSDGKTSHSGGSLESWKFCITDKEYRKRKKEAGNVQ